MPPDSTNLGKLISKHPTTPAFVQRAAIVALLSFLFFLAMLVAFLARQHFGYLILAAAFLVLNIFTLIGFTMQRRNIVKVFENGLSYGKTRIEWRSVSSISVDEKRGAVIDSNDGTSIIIPRTVADFDKLVSYINVQVKG